jgi:acyl carrier protein
METVETELLRLVNQMRRNKRQPELCSLTGDPHLRNDWHFDSLDLAELTVRIEERFGIDVFEAGVVYRWEEIRTRVTRHAASHK